MSFFKVESVPLDDGDYIDPSVIGDTRPRVLAIDPRGGLVGDVPCIVVRILLQCDPSGEQWWGSALAVSEGECEGGGHAVLGCLASAADPATALGALLRKIETGKGWKPDDFGRKWAGERFGFTPWKLVPENKRKSNKRAVE